MHGYSIRVAVYVSLIAVIFIVARNATKPEGTTFRIYPPAPRTGIEPVPTVRQTVIVPS